MIFTVGLFDVLRICRIIEENERVNSCLEEDPMYGNRWFIVTEREKVFMNEIVPLLRKAGIKFKITEE